MEIISIKVAIEIYRAFLQEEDRQECLSYFRMMTASVGDFNS